MPLSRSQTARQGIGGMFNFGADFPASNRNLRRTRAAKARVRAAAGSAYIACLGDSNVKGIGSDGLAANGTAGYNGWPNKLATLLTANGIKAQCEGFFGSGATSAQDNRLTFSSGVQTPPIGTGVPAIGGSLFQFTATGQTLTFATKTACTALDFYYVTGSASVTFAVDGGAATTFSMGGAFAMAKTTISLGTLGLHTIVMTCASGTPYFLGFDCYDATTPLLHILNWGLPGSKVTDWLPASPSIWSPVQAIPFFKPDLVIGPVLETNDWATANGITPAAMSASKQTLLSSWTSTSDTLLLTCGPTAASSCPPLAGQKPYIDADYALALANGIPLLDDWAAMGDEPFAQGLGLYNTDFTHKTAAGHYATAELVARAILAA